MKKLATALGACAIALSFVGPAFAQAEPMFWTQEKLMRVAGLRAVQALFKTAPDRVERLFFLGDLRSQLSDYCGLLARARKPYRQVGVDELAKVAGTVLHGGVVALARPREVRFFEAGEARHWPQDGKLLLVLDGIQDPHNLGACLRVSDAAGVHAEIGRASCRERV